MFAGIVISNKEQSLRIHLSSIQSPQALHGAKTSQRLILILLVHHDLSCLSSDIIGVILIHLSAPVKYGAMIININRPFLLTVVGCFWLPVSI